MLTREMFCHKFYLLDGGGAGDGGFGEADLGAGPYPGVQGIGTSGGFSDVRGVMTDVPGVQGIGTTGGYGDVKGVITDIPGPSPGPEVSPGPPGPGTGETVLTGESAGGIKELGGIKEVPIESVAPGVITITPEVKTEAKGVPKPKKRQRRPTILSEEMGLMYTAPGRRRSLLGG